MSESINPKIIALAKFLEETDLSEIDQSRYNEDLFNYGRQEYLVLDDEESEAKCKEQILDSLWAFNADFIIYHTNLPYESIEMIKNYQETKCEDCNETIKALITDLDKFVEDAISSDGRGHFLATYDGEEPQIDEYFIYRTN